MFKFSILNIQFKKRKGKFFKRSIFNQESQNEGNILSEKKKNQFVCNFLKLKELKNLMQFLEMKNKTLWHRQRRTS